MSQRAGLYLGRAGQLAVMGEFLCRGYNAAVPEVDIGDDILVVRDRDGDLNRIQVKTATGAILKRGGYKTFFRVPLAQLQAPASPELTYIFVARLAEAWRSFLVMPRAELEVEHTIHGVGSKSAGGLTLYISHRANGSASCSRRDWSKYVGDWSAWPRIHH